MKTKIDPVNFLPKHRISTDDIPLANALKQMMATPEWELFAIEYFKTRELYIKSMTKNALTSNDRDNSMKLKLLEGFDYFFDLPQDIVTRVEKMLKEEEEDGSNSNVPTDGQYGE